MPLPFSKTPPAGRSVAGGFFFSSFSNSRVWGFHSRDPECKGNVNSPHSFMTESPLEGLEMPPLPPVLEQELSTLGPDGADRLIGILRGLFHCIGDLNQRIAELEERLAD